MKNKVEILCAAFTPMLPDGSVNWNQVRNLFHHCMETKANGVFLNGTTGECMSLSLQERIQLADAWMKCKTESTSPDFKIFVHVGSCNLVEAAQMAEHAQSKGADGIAMVPTFYFRPKTIEDVLDQCEYVASAAPEIPFYYYNIPSLTGVNFPLINFLERAIKRIPNFAGVKNSFTDLVDYQHCLHFSKGKYPLYWGTDEAFMMLYAGGNRHYVGSTYNYMNSLYLKLIDAHYNGEHDTVLQLQNEADAMYKIILAYNNIIAGKEIMRIIGVDCGPVRVPLKALTPADRETFFRKISETTLFAYAAKNSLTKTYTN